MAFTLPELPYPHDALAPYMSRETLEFHHDRHHAAYVTNGNNLAKGTEWENKPVEEVVKGTFGKERRSFNNAAQHYNHIHFWKWMKKEAAAATRSPPSWKSRSPPTSAQSPSSRKISSRPASPSSAPAGAGWRSRTASSGDFEDAERRRIRWCTAPRPSSAATCGSTLTSIDYRNRRPDYLKAFFESLDQLGPCRRDVRFGDQIGAVTAMRAWKRGLAPRFYNRNYPGAGALPLPHCAHGQLAASFAVRGAPRL